LLPLLLLALLLLPLLLALLLPPSLPLPLLQLLFAPASAPLLLRPPSASLLDSAATAEGNPGAMGAYTVLSTCN
jgi:hypothetical protein